ncbi:hypothetical protein BGW80DRAFT_1563449 [Lactifluus volemus]|nr:hypothetical protein BGW80DRAFT_1563449 [Lactifluus volemus]
MDSPVFRKLQEAIEHLCRSREWFALAEQTINTVYAPGDQQEVLSDTLIKDLLRCAFRQRERSVPSAAEEQVSFAAPDEDVMDEDPPPSAQASVSTVPGSTQGALTGNAAKKTEKIARGTGNDAVSKDGEELDQVAGNAEDEIGDRIAAVRETELVYGPDSLLALYGPLLDILVKARSNKAANEPDSELNELESALEESRRQGAEDQAFEKRVEGKKAAAKKRAIRRTQQHGKDRQSQTKRRNHPPYTSYALHGPKKLSSFALLPNLYSLSFFIFTHQFLFVVSNSL